MLFVLHTSATVVTITAVAIAINETILKELALDVALLGHRLGEHLVAEGEGVLRVVVLRRNHAEVDVAFVLLQLVVGDDEGEMGLEGAVGEHEVDFDDVALFVLHRASEFVFRHPAGSVHSRCAEEGLTLFGGRPLLVFFFGLFGCDVEHVAERADERHHVLSHMVAPVVLYCHCCHVTLF